MFPNTLDTCENVPEDQNFLVFKSVVMGTDSLKWEKAKTKSLGYFSSAKQ